LLVPPIDAYSVLIPLDALSALEREIEASLKPSHPREVHEAVEALRAIQRSSTIDPEALSEGLHIKLAEYPVDILQEAVSYAWGKVEWLTIAGMVAICERLIEPRRKQLRTIAQMEAEHRRRQQEAAKRKAQAELEAKREMELEAQREAHQRRLRDVETQARERLGDDALLPGDLELADGLLADGDWATTVHRCGKPILWLNALAGGERWAAQFCRQMALAGRTKRAVEQGRVSSEDALATAKLISAHEESARRQIEEMEGRPVKYRDRPTESFWRALFRIHRAAGLDARFFPEDRAAAAIDNLEHLTGLAALADERSVLDRKAIEEWERRPGRLVSLGPPEPPQGEQ
jgi:hypothetical protein